VLLARWALANAELFSPMWLKAEVPKVDPVDMWVLAREPTSALLFIREPWSCARCSEPHPPRIGSRFCVKL